MFLEFLFFSKKLILHIFYQNYLIKWDFRKDFFFFNNLTKLTIKIGEPFLLLACAWMAVISYSLFRLLFAHFTDEEVQWWAGRGWLERSVGVACNRSPPLLSLLLLLSSMQHSPGAQVVLSRQEQSWSSDSIIFWSPEILGIENVLK